MRRSLPRVAALFVCFLFALTSSAVAQQSDKILLVSDSGNDRVARFDGQTGEVEGAFIPPGSGGLNNPQGLLLGPDGVVYVASFDGDRVLRYAAQTGAFLGALDPSNTAGLNGPVSLALGPGGKLYVADHLNSRVLRYDIASAMFDTVFVTASSGGLHTPRGLAFGPDSTGDGVGELFVGSKTGNSVLRYNGATGAFIDAFVPSGSGGLIEPSELNFRPDGLLYVNSFQNGQVLRYDAATGAFHSTFISLGDNPMGGLFGPDGNYYISMSGSNGVSRFDGTTGAFIDHFVALMASGLNFPTYLAFIPRPPCAQPPSGAVALWKGESDGSDSVGQSHGTLVNGATVAPARVGNGFDLDMFDDFVEIPDAPAVSVTGAISVDAWVRPDSSSRRRAILAKSDPDAGQASYSFGLEPGTSGGRVYFVVYESGNGGTFRGARTTNEIPVGSFSHVAATFNPSTQALKLYVDGADMTTTLIEGSATVSSVFDGTAPARIGAFADSFGDIIAFDGVVDEVGLYDRELTAGEVVAVWNAGASGRCAAPVDLSVTKLDAPDPVLVGGVVNYTVTVKNLSGTHATGVTVTDQLPAGLAYVSDTGGCSYAAAGHKLTCPVGLLGANSSHSFNVAAQPTAGGELTNLVSVVGNEPDPFTSNNTRAAVTGVRTLRRFTLASEQTTGGCQDARAVQASVLLTGPAPAGGATVLLSSSDPSAAGVPASVSLPAGADSVEFLVTPGAVASDTPATITATLDTALATDPALTQPLTVHPVRVLALTLAQESVVGGNTVTQNFVTLACAPATQTELLLTSDRPAAASVPPSLTFAAGDDAGTFNITTNPVAVNRRVAIRATAGGRTRTQVLTVTPP